MPGHQDWAPALRALQRTSVLFDTVAARRPANAEVRAASILMRLRGRDGAESGASARDGGEQKKRDFGFCRWLSREP